jgi:hypothetical protein
MKGSPARRRRRVAIVAASLAIAIVSAAASISHITLLPPKLEPRAIEQAGAVAHVLVDVERSRIADRRAAITYFELSKTRTNLLATLMASAPVLEHIARRADVPPDQIAAVSPITGPLAEPVSEQRARQISLEGRPYRLEIQAGAGGQVLDIYTQARSVPAAKRLADAALPGLHDYLRASAGGEDGGRSPIALEQLGPARGAMLTAGNRAKLAALAFMLAFAVALAALHGLVAIALRRRAAPSRPPAVAAARSDAWPRTTRVLPWMVAGFMAMLWLAPFDSIQLDIPSPIDLKLDRMLLPILVVTWVAALMLGGRESPRLQPTWMHAALGAFVSLAFLSVILGASALDQTLDLDTAIKKLPLLLSYLTLFLIMASVVRREEVPAFVTFTLGLAVAVALGMVWEDQAFNNVFFHWSDTLLPSVFDVSSGGADWDSAGRRMVHGPAQHPLAAASMLSMAMPIAVLGLIHARRTGGRLFYLLAIGALTLGVLATERKTAFIAPAVGVLTIAYFRRRELLRLTPVAVAGVVAVVVMAPGAVAPVLDQFKPDKLNGANTVQDRATDYDAIRPDVWSHVALGRGYGSYQPLGHRILDSEILVRLIEMGVLGLVSFLLLGVSVIACARRTIHSRHPTWGTAALAGAAAAAVFLALAFLFDSNAFAQVPYIFFCFAALVAALIKRPETSVRHPSATLPAPEVETPRPVVQV